MESKSLPYIEGCPPLGLSQLFSHSTLLPCFYPYAYATLNPLYFPKFNTCNFKATCMEWPGLSNEHLYFLRPSAQCLLPWRFSCSLLLIQKLFFPPASPWLAPAHPRIPSRWLKHLSWSASFLPWPSRHQGQNLTHSSANSNIRSMSKQMNKWVNKR